MYSADDAADVGLVDAVGESRSVTQYHHSLTCDFIGVGTLSYLKREFHHREDTLTQCREVLRRLTRETHPEVKDIDIKIGLLLISSIQ